MKKLIVISFLLLTSCVTQSASKNSDLKSPCAGCDNRVSPSENIKYLV